MATTKFSFFDISTSDRGDFPRIIEIALYFYNFVENRPTVVLCSGKSNSRLPLMTLPTPSSGSSCDSDVSVLALKSAGAGVQMGAWLARL